MTNFMNTAGAGGLSLNNYQSLMGYNTGQANSGLGLDWSNLTGTPLTGTNAAAAVTGNGTGSIWDSFLTNKNADGSTSGGYGTAAMGAASGLLNGYLAMQQYGLAKDTLQANKDQFALNYGAQKLAYNSNVTDRNAARAASREGSSNPYSTLQTLA